ncbi:agmatinase [Clostridium cylindrosporum]|uniref:Agmatinase SpeB n=1 Tax=Clostridium cylindrosporum DSM 605 TaxID=1121307 RepID=A0A0J8G6F5_CLOCY|nr:agmatinase [Clostridium cylindrosporum]KMT23186.1 agmatinase SpeB [Clostridium cylindrosporum DSM 605]
MLNTYSTSSFIGFDSNYEDSTVVMFGAPFDGTTSFRPGTRFAPAQIRIDSYGLETYSPYLDLDLEDFKISDIGDVDMPFGNTEKALEAIKTTSKAIIGDEKKPLLIGGEHLVSLPVIESLYNAYPDLHIIHFDAHTDLREDYMGEKLSHATVIRRAHDILGDNRIYQFGIRSGTREEFKWSNDHTIMNKFDLSTLESAVKNLSGKPVYLTIDLDVLDPSVFSGTGTPEPGGITMKELLNGINIMKDLNLVGADVVELSPSFDTSGVSTAVACKVIREVSLILAK